MRSCLENRIFRHSQGNVSTAFTWTNCLNALLCLYNVFCVDLARSLTKTNHGFIIVISNHIFCQILYNQSFIANALAKQSSV